MKLSIVTTLYRSEPYLREFHRRVSAAAREQCGADYEIVLVNDGSPDRSLDLALELQAGDAHTQVVELSRNFGHHAAIVAGLSHTRGERVFLIDCDLEEQPEWLLTFSRRMDESAADVVFAVQQERVASAMANLSARLFWSVFNAMSSVRMPRNPMTCRLMQRRYVDALLEVGDRVLFLEGVFAWTGFRQVSIPLRKVPRSPAHGSSYSLSRKLATAVDSFASFTTAPLSLIFVAGCLVWLGSVAYALYLGVRKLLYPELVLSGFTSVMLSIWFLGGTIILVLGVLGLYLGKLFQEVRRRPLYVVRRVHAAESEAAGSAVGGRRRVTESEEGLQ